jgi:hypothetical protein
VPSWKKNGKEQKLLFSKASTKFKYLPQDAQKYVREIYLQN